MRSGKAIARPRGRKFSKPDEDSTTAWMHRPLIRCLLTAGVKECWGPCRNARKPLSFDSDDGLVTSRFHRGWSQEEFAARSGRHWTYFGQVERGTRHVTLLTIHELASALGVEPFELLSSKLSDGVAGAPAGAQIRKGGRQGPRRSPRLSEHRQMRPRTRQVHRCRTSAAPTDIRTGGSESRSPIAGLRSRVPMLDAHQRGGAATVGSRRRRYDAAHTRQVPHPPSFAKCPRRTSLASITAMTATT